MPRKVLTGFLLAFLSLIFISVISYRSLMHSTETEARVKQSYVVLEHLGNLMVNLADAETRQRGFLLTEEKNYLNNVASTMQEVEQELVELRSLTVENPRQQKWLETLRPLVQGRLAFLGETLRLSRAGEMAAARELIRSPKSISLTEEIRTVFAEAKAEERAQLVQGEAESRTISRRTVTVLLIGSSAGTLMLLGVHWLLLRLMGERQKTQEALQETNESLNESLGALASTTGEIRLLGEMGDLLQSCQNAEEAAEVISRYMVRLFPNGSGALYLMNNSHDLMQGLAVWGDAAPPRHDFGLDDCWALRRGRAYLDAGFDQSVVCRHCRPPAHSNCDCIPLVAQHETLGLLQQMNPPTVGNGTSGSGATQERSEVVQRIAERIAPALANLRLRETLRNQSILDPLTGLFNRRHMEEVLERELRRAARHQRPLGVVMIDLDHFKEFNDTYGHGAGDALLHATGAFLQTQIRQEDIACRYGGEEFVLVMPEASIEVVHDRAEKLREQVRSLGWVQKLKPGQCITFSAGVAVWPDHGDSPGAILRAADRALYQAKQSGRNRVVLAGFEQPAALKLV